MIVSLKVDSREWSAAVSEWSALAHREGVSANLDAAKVVRDRAREILDEGWHPEGTKSPKPKGTAPGSITGLLADSIEVSRDGDDAIVGPTSMAESKNGPYGRFLELGGEHIAHSGNPGWGWGGYYYPTLMWWKEDGVEHKAPYLKKLPRPYLKEATVTAIASGEITEQYIRHWLIAQEAVTH